MKVKNIIVSLLLFTTYSYAQESEEMKWEELDSLIYIHSDLGEYDIALGYAQKSLELAKNFYPESEYPNGNSIILFAYFDVGYFYRKLHKYQKAEQYLLKYFEIAQKLYPEGKFPNGHVNLMNAYYQIGHLYELKTQYEKAIPYFIQSQEIARRLYPEKDYPNGNKDLILSINNLGNIYSEIGEYEKAKSLFDEALQMSYNYYQSENEIISMILNNFANYYSDIANHHKAEEYFLKALKINQQVYKKEHPIIASSLNNLAELYANMNQIKKAEYFFKRSIVIYRKIYDEDNPNLALTLNNLASLYLQMNNFSMCKSLLYESLEMYQSLHNSDNYDLAMVYNNLGFYYSKIGEINKAEGFYLKSLDMRKQLFGDENIKYVTSLNNLAFFYFEIGDFKKAENYHNQAYNILKQKHNSYHPYIATTLSGLAQTFFKTGRTLDSEKLLIEALKIRKVNSLTNKYDLERSFNQIANFYFEVGKIEEAEQYYNEALKLNLNIYSKGHPDFPTALNSRATYYYRLQKISLSIISQEASIEEFRNIYINEHIELATSIMNASILYNINNECDKAEPYFKEALNMYRNIFKQNSQSMSESERQKYWETMSFNFELFFSFVKERYEENPDIAKFAFDNLLFTKGMLLNETLKMRKRILNSGNQEAMEIFNKWRANREFYANLSQMPKKELEKTGYSLDSINNVTNELEKQLFNISESFVIDTTVYTSSDIISKLRPNEAAVEIFRFNYYDKHWTDTVFYAALILTDKSEIPEFVLLENGNELEEKEVQKFRNSIYRKMLSGQVIPNANYTVPLGDLYSSFWQPIADALPAGTEKVYLSPDGVFNLINPDLLINPETEDYLGNEMDIVLVSNSKEIMNADNSGYNADYAVLFGNPSYTGKPEFITEEIEDFRGNSRGMLRAGYVECLSGQFSELPYTKVEVEQIDGILANSNYTVETKTETLATEEAIKDLHNPEILHIATHGFFCESDKLPEQQRMMMMAGNDIQKPADNPLLRSGLVFSGANESIKAISNGEYLENTNEDGILTAYEAQNLMLDSTQLVVLSACETALGEIQNGEGVVGLQRAIKSAGAKYLLMSLWQIDDRATQEFMVKFYEQYSETENIRQSFDYARKYFQEHEKYNLPYYWGAFVLIGV